MQLRPVRLPEEGTILDPPLVNSLDSLYRLFGAPFLKIETTAVALNYNRSHQPVGLRIQASSTNRPEETDYA